jgi:hypothetical protein
LGRIFAKNGQIKGRNPILLGRMACAVTHVEFSPHPSQKMALFPPYKVATQNWQGIILSFGKMRRKEKGYWIQYPEVYIYVCIYVYIYM